MMRRPALLLSVCLLALGAPLSAQAYRTISEFKGAFSAAVKKDDFVLLKSLVESNQKHLFPAFQSYEIDWCALGLKEGDEAAATALGSLSQTIEMLGMMTRQVTRDPMLVGRWSWVQSLTKEQKQAKLDLAALIGKADPLFGKAQKARTTATAEAAIPLFDQAHAKAVEAGDIYWQANCCFYLAYLYEFQIKYYEASYYYKKGSGYARNAGFARQQIENFQLPSKLKIAAEKGRIKTDLIDTELAVAESHKKYKEAIAKGATAPVIVDPDSPGEGAPAAKKAAAATIELGPPPTNHSDTNMEWRETKGFKVKKESRGADFWTTWNLSNGDWLMWRTLIIKKGEQVTCPFLPGKIKLENDSGKVFMLKGKKKERLKLKGKPSVTEFKKVEYLDGSKGKVYQMLMQRPTQYKCMGIGLRSSGDAVVINFKGASNVVGKLRGVDFSIHDSNGNGAFNDWGIDTIVIGKGKKAMMAPLSRYVNLGGLMYELKVNANGQSVRTKPWDGDMAPLRVKYESNTMPRYLIASGSGGDATYFLNLLDAVDKPIWVVPGNLQFAHGYIADGKGLKAKSIQIVKGRSGVFNAQVGQMNTWELGGAGTGFTFGFKTESRRKSGQDYVVVPAKSIQVFGAFGEEYRYFLTGHVLPEVSMRKGKDGGVWLAKKKMRRPEREDINQDGELIWYPKALEVKKGAGGDYSVMLEADYPPLGRIASSWQAGE